MPKITNIRTLSPYTLLYSRSSDGPGDFRWICYPAQQLVDVKKNLEKFWAHWRLNQVRYKKLPLFAGLVFDDMYIVFAFKVTNHMQGGAKLHALEGIVGNVSTWYELIQYAISKFDEEKMDISLGIYDYVSEYQKKLERRVDDLVGNAEIEFTGISSNRKIHTTTIKTEPPDDIKTERIVFDHYGAEDLIDKLQRWTKPYPPQFIFCSSADMNREHRGRIDFIAPYSLSDWKRGDDEPEKRRKISAEEELKKKEEELKKREEELKERVAQIEIESKRKAKKKESEREAKEKINNAKEQLEESTEEAYQRENDGSGITQLIFRTAILATTVTALVISIVSIVLTIDHNAHISQPQPVATQHPLLPSKSAPAEYTVAFVESAVTRYKANGRSETVEYYGTMESFDDQWYLFIADEDNAVIVYPSDPGKLGMTITAVTGTVGNTSEIDEALSDADRGVGGRFDYMDVNPATGLQELKHAYIIRHDGLLFGSGWYDSSSSP